uniref:Transcription repressor n=1 Tax=Solanum lycopersicum TaxID=4081 RepID=A0A3Q7HPG3_SOLLC
MDNHIVNKFSRLFPSSFTSCQFRNIPDVVENSFIISKNSKFVHNNAVGVSSRTNSSIKTQESKSNKNTLLKSSSSNSGWFSSEGENDETEDAFFSLSSGYFSDSFRRKPDESCRKMYNQKSSEMGRCYSELSVNSVSRVGSNLGESKWVKSRNGTSKTEQNGGKVSRTLRETEQNRGKTSRTARKTANQNDSEMSPSSSALWRTNERVHSNLDESKWVKSINELDFTTSKTEQNRGKAESKWVKSINELDFASSNTEQNRGKPIRTARKTANQNDSEMSHSSSELSMINEQVNSNLDELKRVKSINELDFTISKTEQNRVNTSRKTPPRSSRRTLRKTTPVEKFDYYSDFTSNTRRKTTKCRRKIKKSSSTSSDEMGRIKIVIEGRIEESIAVEKNTNDPHNDFRTSMLEMIVEKQIFGLKDLQRLLHCFLSLNSPSFHKIIFEVFAEIFETLFH